MNGWNHRTTKPNADGTYDLLVMGVNDVQSECEKDIERIEWRDGQWWGPTGEAWGADGLTPDMRWR